MSTIPENAMSHAPSGERPMPATPCCSMYRVPGTPICASVMSWPSLERLKTRDRRSGHGSLLRLRLHVRGCPGFLRSLPFQPALIDRALARRNSLRGLVHVHAHMALRGPGAREHALDHEPVRRHLDPLHQSFGELLPARRRPGWVRHADRELLALEQL